MSVVALNAFASGGVAVSVVTNAGYVGADTVDADASCFVDLSFYCRCCVCRGCGCCCCVLLLCVLLLICAVAVGAVGAIPVPFT